MYWRNNIHFHCKVCHVVPLYIRELRTRKIKFYWPRQFGTKIRYIDLSNFINYTHSGAYSQCLQCVLLLCGVKLQPRSVSVRTLVYKAFGQFDSFTYVAPFTLKYLIIFPFLFVETRISINRRILVSRTLSYDN